MRPSNGPSRTRTVQVRMTHRNALLSLAEQLVTRTAKCLTVSCLNPIRRLSVSPCSVVRDLPSNLHGTTCNEQLHYSKWRNSSAYVFYGRDLFPMQNTSLGRIGVRSVFKVFLVLNGGVCSIRDRIRVPFRAMSV